MFKARQLFMNDFKSKFEYLDLIIYSKSDSFIDFNPEKCLKILENSQKNIFIPRLDLTLIGMGNLMCNVLSVICLTCYVPIEESRNGFGRNF